jgi:hypothetical protein
MAAPWTDKLLLPLGKTESQKEHEINEQQFEKAGINLHTTLFDQGQWDNFANYLVQHPANESHRSKMPHEITWVLLIQLLRNIVEYESHSDWKGILECLDQVLLYTKSRQNFRELIHEYKQALLGHQKEYYFNDLLL